MYTTLNKTYYPQVNWNPPIPKGRGFLLMHGIATRLHRRVSASARAYPLPAPQADSVCPPVGKIIHSSIEVGIIHMTTDSFKLCLSSAVSFIDAAAVVTRQACIPCRYMHENPSKPRQFIAICLRNSYQPWSRWMTVFYGALDKKDRTQKLGTVNNKREMRTTTQPRVVSVLWFLKYTIFKLLTILWYPPPVGV